MSNHKSGKAKADKKKEACLKSCLSYKLYNKMMAAAPAAYANSNITNTQTHTHTSVMLKQVSTGGTHLYVQVCVQHVRLMITSQ